MKKIQISVAELESERQPSWEKDFSHRDKTVHMMAEIPADAADGKLYSVHIMRQSFDDKSGDRRLKVGDYWYKVGNMAQLVNKQNEAEPVDPAWFEIVP